MRGIPLFLALAALAIASPVAAQESSTTFRERILGAIRLPEATQEARVLGVPETDIRKVFAAARERRLPAGALTQVIVTENEAVRQNGPIENFGAFVQSKLDQGLRGRDLAAAIRAEHAARGIGRGKRLRAPSSGGHGAAAVGRPADAGKAGAAHGKSGDAGNTQPKGKSAAPGKGGPGGQPDAAGKGAGNTGAKGGSR